MRMSVLHRWAMLVIIGMALITAGWMIIQGFNALVS